MKHLLKYPSDLSFCPYFPRPRRLHSSLGALRGRENDKQKSGAIWVL